MTLVLMAFVLHTQTAKLARWPAFTCDAAENDCTRTQSCGVFFFLGGGEVVCEVVGVGVGLGLVELGLGVGVDEPEPLDDLWVGDGLGLLCDFDELGVGDGVEVGDLVVLEPGDLVGLGDFFGLGDVVGLADFVEVADFVELADLVELAALVRLAALVALADVVAPVAFL